MARGKKSKAGNKGKGKVSKTKPNATPNASPSETTQQKNASPLPNPEKEKTAKPQEKSVVAKNNNSAPVPPATPENTQSAVAKNNDSAGASPPPKKKAKSSNVAPSKKTKPPLQKKKSLKDPSPSKKTSAKPRTRASRHASVAKMQTGGAHNCGHCKKLCNYGHQCPLCKGFFHPICALSLHNGKSMICVDCFEKSKGKLGDLDSHMHAPYSPECFVPFHPYTRKYTQSRGQLDFEVRNDLTMLPDTFTWHDYLTY